jgi:exopolysaccharide biosynthesis protein
MNFRSIVFAFLLGVFLTAFLPSEGVSQISSSWPSDPILNVPISTVEGAQVVPQLISDGAGGVIIAWFDLRNDPIDGIYAQRVDADGNALWTTDGVPVSTVAGDIQQIRLISDGAGGAIITWMDSRNDPPGDDYIFGDIYAQRVDANGNVLWTADGVPISMANGDQRDPQLISDGAGGAIITWTDDRDASPPGFLNHDVYAQRIDADGNVLWAADGVPISTATAGQGVPQLVSDGMGGAIIIWGDNRVFREHNLYAQRVDANGNVLWATDGMQITSTSDVGHHQLIGDGSGGAIIVAVRSAWSIRAQRMDTNGNLLWSPNWVTIASPSVVPVEPQLVSDAAGGVIISWRDRRNDIFDDIYAQRVDANGSVRWTQNGVPISTATDLQTNPSLVDDGAGGAIITWQDSRSFPPDLDPNTRNSFFDIFSQRVDANGNVLWTPNGVPVTTAPDFQMRPQLVSDGVGGAIITWYDNRNVDHGDIYAQNVNPDGTLGSTPLVCDETQAYDGVEHCTKGPVQILKIAPDNLEQVSFETVLPEGYDENAIMEEDKKECADVNIPEYSDGPGCQDQPISQGIGKYPGETVEQMATRYERKGYNVIAVFNTDLFSYPHYHHGPEGLTVKNGQRFDGPLYKDDDENEVKRPSLSISRHGNVRIGKVESVEHLPGKNEPNRWYPDQNTYWNSVGGHPLLVTNSVSVVDTECPNEDCGVDGASYRARTAVGKTSDGKLIIAVIPEANGVTLNELAKEMLKLGAVEAMNLDGGGSSQLWYNGGYLVESSDNPDRPVAEGLLVYISPEEPSATILETIVHLFLGYIFDDVFHIVEQLPFNLIVWWPGSDVNLVLTQPDGTILSLNDPNVTYTKTGNYISVTVQNPQPGDWELEIQAVDMPPDGEHIQIKVVAANSENVDVTPPVTTLTLDGIPGENGWVVSDVTMSLAATDDLSGIATTSYSIDNGNIVEGSTITLGEEGVHTVQFYSVDNAENIEGTQKITVQIDKTPPVLTVPSDITVEGNITNGANVTLPAVTATDLADPAPVVSCDHSSGFFPLGATIVTCTATDTAGHGSSDSFNVTVVDTAPPDITCPAHINGMVGESISLGSPTVLDIVDPSPAITNDAPESYSPGTTTVTWTATDASGNSASCSQKVTLIYNFSGFFAPVDNPPVQNSAKAGKAIPVKFSLDGDQGLDILATEYPKTLQIDCDSLAPANDVEETITAGDSSLSYDADSDHYNYVWKTEKAWANTCRHLVVKLNDDTEHIAYFEFK